MPLLTMALLYLTRPRRIELFPLSNRYFMLISRNQFFMLLLFLVVTLSLGSRLIWLARSDRIIGKVSFTGKSQAGQFMHTYSVIQFRYKDSLYWFNGQDNLLFEENALVPVRFDPGRPADARIDHFLAIWGDRIVFGGIPMLVLLIIFLQREIFPRNYALRLRASRPLISLIKMNEL